MAERLLRSSDDEMPTPPTSVKNSPHGEAGVVASDFGWAPPEDVLGQQTVAAAGPPPSPAAPLAIENDSEPQSILERLDRVRASALADASLPPAGAVADTSNEAPSHSTQGETPKPGFTAPSPPAASLAIENGDEPEGIFARLESVRATALADASLAPAGAAADTRDEAPSHSTHGETLKPGLTAPDITAWLEAHVAPGAGVARAARSWISANGLRVAVVALALIAWFEGVYILRNLWPGSAAVGNAATAAPITTPPAPAAAREQVDTDQQAAVTSTAGRTRDAASGATGTLTVRSDPAGAEVVLDGRPHGVTPLTLTKIAPGEHRLTLRQGPSELRQTIRVAAGATVSVLAPFQAAGAGSGWLTINTPNEFDIFEKGALLGTTRSKQIMVPAGVHTLELVNEKLGYRETQQVRVDAGAQKTIALQLPLGNVSVNARPWAEVWVDGERVGETPLGNLKLPIGDHQITFRHPELGERTVTATVKVGNATRVTADLQSPKSSEK